MQICSYDLMSQNSDTKKFLKKFQKPLDKKLGLCYNIYIIKTKRGTPNEKDRKETCNTSKRGL